MSTLRIQFAVLTLMLLVVSCAPDGGSPVPSERALELADHDAGATVALPDLGPRLYLDQFQGGLYPDGLNVIPADHAARAAAATAGVQPIRGKYVLISMGMSITSQEFCCQVNDRGQNQDGGINAWSFMGQAAADPAVNHESLVIVNGAAGGQTAKRWMEPTHWNYDRIRDSLLTPAGLSEDQVRVLWMQVTNAQPEYRLPHPRASAYDLERKMGRIVRATRVRWPNLEIVFVSTMTYAGYSLTKLHHEPHAYEDGFAAKWLVEAQIRQARTGTIDGRAGDLGPNLAPVLVWGPYLWADGSTPRWDGFSWTINDVERRDGLHPSALGEEKVGRALMEFFKVNPFSQCWFLSSRAC